MSADYYRALNLEPRLSLDAADLERRFYNLSRQLHPDRFTRAAPAERERALEASATLNDAYRTLRNPVARAEYFLRTAGFDSGGQPRSKQVPPELLEEVFQLNMALEELRGGDGGARPQIEAAGATFAAHRDELDAELLSLFARYDAGPDRALLARIRALLDRRRYIANLLNEIEKELAA